jgi:phosphopentomutase
VLDGVGAGAAPDAAAYGDVGSDTLGNVARAVGGLSLPALERLGLGNAIPVQGVAPRADARGAWGLMLPRSAGKDSTTGHWEIAGLHLERPFPTYPGGFPPEVVAEFARRTGRRVIANVVGSGTAVIDEWGDEHRRTGGWIVYTSADSVFQVAAHERVVPLAELYAACEEARRMLAPPHDVSRVIARPFEGAAGAFRPAPSVAPRTAATSRSRRLARRCSTRWRRPGCRGAGWGRWTTCSPGGRSPAATRRATPRGWTRSPNGWPAARVGSSSPT